VPALTVASVERIKPDATRRREIPDAALPGHYLVVQPSGAKSFALRYRHGSKPRKLTLGSYPSIDLVESRNRARGALRAIGEGRDPGVEKIATRKASATADTVEVVAAQFLERHVRAKNRRKTEEEAGRTFRRRVIPAWGKLKIEDIGRKDIVRLLDAIMDEGKPVAANRTLAVVRKFFNWCVDRAILEASPCVRIKAPAFEASRERVLSDGEIRRVWVAAQQIGFPFGPFVQILVLTGQRRDEVAGIRRRELKEGGALWTIPGERTKNCTEHDVPLAPAVQGVIASVPRISTTEYLFTTTGEKPISGYSNAKERLDAVIARAEPTGRDGNTDETVIEPWRLHDLRRTVASGMARLGIPVHVIEAVLNHRSGQVSGVAAVYNRHSYLLEKRRALEGWANYVEGLVRDASQANVAALSGDVTTGAPAPERHRRRPLEG
jgi:integrase